jgi:hypothetical protein
VSNPLRPANAGGPWAVIVAVAEMATVPGKPSTRPGERKACSDERCGLLRHHACRPAGGRAACRSCPGSNPRCRFAGQCRNQATPVHRPPGLLGIDIRRTTRGNTDAHVQSATRGPPIRRSVNRRRKTRPADVRSDAPVLESCVCQGPATFRSSLEGAQTVHELRKVGTSGAGLDTGYACCRIS